MRPTGTPKTYVWRWQDRFATEGLEGLLRDKSRPRACRRSGQEVIDKVVSLTAASRPTTHRTVAAVAKAVGISISSVQRMAHGLAPHRLLRFKLSRDPDFVPHFRRASVTADPKDWV
jgi:hypothetical protein